MAYWRSTNHVYQSLELIADPRTEDWPLVNSAWPTICCSIFYLVSVKLFSLWMQDRAPLNIQGLMVVYNAVMVAASAYMFAGFVFHGLPSGLTIFCWSVNPRVTDHTMGLAAIFWWYYISKVIEFLDTWFFIARKRFTLVTVLHVFHHMIMPLNSWLAIKFAPGGFVTVPFMLNSGVHVFMYTYYALAALGPGYKHFLFWKKYMTILQICQFVFIVLHSVYFLRMDCKFPRVLVGVILANSLIFLLLFSHFYRSSYTPKVIEVKQA